MNPDGSKRDAKKGAGPPLPPELSTLLSAMFDGEMTDAEQMRMADLLRDNSCAQQAYVDYCLTHALLRRELGAYGEVPFSTEAAREDSPPLCGQMGTVPLFPSIAPPPIIVQSSPNSASSLFSLSSPLGGMLVSYGIAAVIVGAMLLGAWAYKTTRFQQFVASPSSPSRDTSAVVFVGRISGQKDCRWADPETETFLGALVPLGRKYALASGLMEITYDSGAKVILEGPCTYKVESRAGGYLALGKLTATVVSGQWSVASAKQKAANPKSPNLQIPNQQIPSPLSSLPSPLFTVRTPTAIITDLGTEFGVEVDKSGASRTHVFQGKVELRRATEGKEGSLLGRFEAGESVRIDATGAIVRDVSPAKGFFVRAQDFSELQLNALRRRRAASLERFRNDPALMAYYAFDNERTSPDRLLNRAVATAGRLDGVLGEPDKPGTRPAWVEGRTPGKRALRFEAEKEQVVVVPHDDLLNGYKGLTVAAWIKARMPLPPYSRVILSRRDPEAEGFQLSVVGPARESPFSIQLYTGARFGDYSGPVLPRRAERDEWWHVAAALSPRYKQFYFNGRLVDQTGHASASAELKSDLWIGAAPPWLGQGRCWFDGLIGEIWIFRRALAPAEIQSLFEYELDDFLPSNVRTSAAGQSLDAPAGASQSSSKEK